MSFRCFEEFENHGVHFPRVGFHRAVGGSLDKVEWCVGENSLKLSALLCRNETVVTPPDEEKGRVGLSPERKKLEGRGSVHHAEKASSRSRESERFYVSLELLFLYFSSVGFLKKVPDA